jgi:hypothetical protein
VANSADQGGNRTEPFGPAPKGMLMLSDTGWYTSLSMRSDLPKSRSGKKLCLWSDLWFPVMYLSWSEVPHVEAGTSGGGGSARLALR